MVESFEMANAMRPVLGHRQEAGPALNTSRWPEGLGGGGVAGAGGMVGGRGFAGQSSNGQYSRLPEFYVAGTAALGVIVRCLLCCIPL